jgi:methionyl-tRNA formyltransferase
VTRAAKVLERQVRAYQPWPGSWLEWQGHRLVVWRAGVVAEPRGDGSPGTLGGTPRSSDARPGDLVVVEDAPVLVTAEGGLRLDEVQPAGGRRMSGAAYLRGQRG